MGGDLWQYTYHLHDFTPQTNVAFEILFDPALYRDLQDPPPAVPDWDILAFQPDPTLPDAGRYSALALSDSASTAGSFTIEFVWLGGQGTTPGSQAYELSEFDNAGDFVRTVPPDGNPFTIASNPATSVPEPGTAILLTLGLVGLFSLKQRVRRSQARHGV